MAARVGVVGFGKIRSGTAINTNAAMNAMIPAPTNTTLYPNVPAITPPRNPVIPAPTPATELSSDQSSEMASLSKWREYIVGHDA